MSVSGISNYSNALLQWQGQQLKSTGSSSAKSSSSNALSSLFGNTSSMTSQLSSMVELTKYAMDAMGLSSDSRVTFSQITKYREQLQEEFSQSVKKGLAQVGVSDPESVTFTLNKDGTLTADSPNASDKKTVQAWLDANPDLGKSLRQDLTSAGLAEDAKVQMRVNLAGKLSVINATQDAMQSALDAQEDLSKDLRAALKEMGVDLSGGMAFVFDDEGNLAVQGENEHAAEVNAWLAENPELGQAVKKEMEKHGVEVTAVTLNLRTEGTLKISANNAELNDIQDVLDKEGDLGKKLYSGMKDLGIDPNANFTIQVNSDGSVTIISDSPDLAKIQQFFDDNPELVKKYRQIEVLSGLDDARKAMQIAPSDMRKRIQIESMAAWWAGSNDASSYFGSYSGGNLSLLTGLNLSV